MSYDFKWQTVLYFMFVHPANIGTLDNGLQIYY